MPAAEVRVMWHGAWLPWLESEFGWSIPTAERFIRVYENIKLVNLTNLEIDVSALYKIAAPSTPEPVREEVTLTIHRACV